LQSQPSHAARQSTPLQAFDAALLDQISAGLARQAHLLEGDCIRTSANASATVLALLGLALHTGSRLALWDMAPDGATLVTEIQRERTGLVFADANTWADVLDARRGTPLSVIAAMDVRDSSPELVGQLLKAGLSVLNVLQVDVLPLPLAAHWIADAAEAGLVGRPLVPHTVRVAERPDSPVPIGVAAPLWVKAGSAGTWVACSSAARWRSDGVLQHVGNSGSDATVLLAGGLVDRLALERAAQALPGVMAAASQLVVDPMGRRRLVIGLQASNLSTLQQEQHARTLIDAVPPMARLAVDVRWFEQLVRHPSGHLQVAQSRAPRVHAASANDSFAGTATEQAIHAVWSELLGMGHIGRNDNFFDLGGTSLTAMQAVLKLEQKIGKQISPRRYVSETLAQLAAAYDATGVSDAPAVPSAPQVDASEPAPGLMKRLVRLVQRA